MGPGYAGAHLPSSYVPSGIPAPILRPPTARPSTVSGYDNQRHNVTPGSVSPVNNGLSGSLKRKASAAKELENTGRYRRYNYGQQRTISGAYQLPADVGPDDCKGDGFGRNDEALPVESKRKQGLVDDLIGKYS
eukprot:g28557.t1